jgi:iron complex outermembrane receptor protein
MTTQLAPFGGSLFLKPSAVLSRVFSALACKRVLAFTAIALLVFPGPPTHAQTTDLTQESLEDLMNIDVTSVSKREQKISQAPAAIFVITSEDIRRSGALDIPDLLRMVPGLDVAQIDSSKWAISARGFNGQYANKLLVLVDGRTVYNPMFAGTFWDTQNVALDSIERIEVIRGPGAAVWGSNAVNGVINVITLSAADTQGGYVSGTAGNNSIGPGSFRYGGKVPGLGAYRVVAEGFQYKTSPTFSGLDGQDDWRLVHGGFRTDSKISARDSLTTEGEGYKGNAGELVATPISIQPPVTATVALRDRYSGWNMLARWDRTISSKSGTSLLAYFDRTTGGDSTYELGLNTFDIDFQHHIVLGARHNIVWGLGYRVTSDDTDPTLRIVFSPQGRRNQLFSAFAQDEIAIVPDRLHLSLGARIEHNFYTGFDLQPSARLVWTVNSKSMIWTATSHADRTPARSDTDLRVNYAALPAQGNMPLLVSLFGNPNKKNELLTAFEGGYRSAWSSKLSLDSTLFYNHYHDLTSVEPGPIILEASPAPVHLLLPDMQGNGLYGETHGIEFYAHWKVTGVWTLSPGYTFFSLHLHPCANSHDFTTASGTEGGSPDHQAQLRSTLSLPRNLQWDTSVYFVNRLPAVSIPSYTRLDTGIVWRVGERVSVSVIGQNLLKNLHPEFAGPSSSVQSGLIRRGAYAKIDWSF